MDKTKIEQGVRLILEGIGEDPEREGLRDTPRRVAEMCQEVLAGIHQEPKPEVGFVDPDIREDVIALTNIPFYSLCEHHLLPFFGKIHIFYVPKDRRVAGFSSLIQIVETFARRLQIQERLNLQIAEAIMESLQPRGVYVIIEATQLCVAMRGTKKQDVRTVTRVVRGDIPLEQWHVESYWTASGGKSL